MTAPQPSASHLNSLQMAESQSAVSRLYSPQTPVAQTSAPDLTASPTTTPSFQPLPSHTLRVTGLKKHFGGVRALDGVDFEIQSGQCVALIGPNGAGKSTCFAALAGQHRPDAGRVEWGATTGPLDDITGLGAAELSVRGIGRSFQVAQVFEALSVLQNLQLVAQYPKGLQSFSLLKNHAQEASMALLAQLGLQELAHSQAQALSYGQKKRLELGIALTGQPRLLLLDEPAAGLAQAERAALMHLIKSLTAPSRNLAVLYTEHNMDAVFGVADRVLVLIDGKLAAQGTPSEIAANETVRSRYLGSSRVA